MVRIGLSPKQLSKMKKGMKVRIRPPMEGKGFNVIVDPANYDLITRTFSRNKGMDIALSPQELEVNKEAGPKMEGQGIFGKTFDRSLKKLIGKQATKALYDEARQLLPLAQMGLTGGLTAGATALGASQPWMVPYLPTAVAGLSALGSDYLANPSQYQSNVGGATARLAKTLAGRYVQDKALSSLNAQLGTNMGDLSRASIEDALANKARAELDALKIRQQQMERPVPSSMGSGLYAGKGLYAGRSMSRSGGAIGLNGGFIRHQPQALQSQPYSSHFQFQHTLPPSYQFQGSGLGL